MNLPGIVEAGGPLEALVSLNQTGRMAAVYSDLLALLPLGTALMAEIKDTFISPKLNSLAYICCFHMFSVCSVFFTTSHGIVIRLGVFYQHLHVQINKEKS